MAQSAFKAFTKELSRGNLGNAVKSLSGGYEKDIQSDVYRDGAWYFGVGGQSGSSFSYIDNESAVRAYTECPELQSLINRRAAAHCNGKRWIMRSGGKGKGKEDQSDYAKKCRRLLANPNPFQTGRQFEAQLKVFLDIWEWCIIMPVYPQPIWAKNGLSEASAMFLIPPSMLEYKLTGNWRSQRKISDVLSEMWLTAGSERTKLDLEQIVILRNFTPRLCTSSLDGRNGMGEIVLFPQSRIQAQQKPISNIISAYETRGELIKYAGSQGIISPESPKGEYVPMGMTPDDKLDLQEQMKKQYGIGIGQFRYIVSDKALKFSQMGRPTKDLMLFEETESDTRALCNAWYFPFKLFIDVGSSMGGTETDAFTRNLYQDSIIPEAASIEEQLAEAFKAHENGTEWLKEYNHLPAMQDDEKRRAETRQVMGTAVINEFESGLITYNRALELMDEDTVEWGNIYYNEWLKLPRNQSENGNTTTDTGSNANA